MLKNTPIRTKLFLAVLALATPVLLLMAGLAYWGGKNAVTQSTFEHLTSVRASKAHQIEKYFDQIRSQARMLARDRMIVDTMIDFDEAYQDLEGVELSEAQREAVEIFYREVFAPRLEASVETEIDGASFQPTSDVDAYLQYHYIVSNPHPFGKKDLLDEAGDDSGYTLVHRSIHPILRDFVREFGYSDLFLISGSGTIVYTVGKEVDLGANLMDGPLRDSNLGMVFQMALQDTLSGSVPLVDYAFYAPSFGEPTSFMAAPILDGAWSLGVLVLEMPVGEIDDVMTSNRNWQISGLGETGESYLVGPDYLMRSDSRFVLEDSAESAESGSAEADAEADELGRLESGSTILLQEVRTEATEAALEGATGTDLIVDYRGVEVLSSYAPLRIEGVDWVVLSEIDAEEAFARVRGFTRNLVFAMAVVLAALLVGAWFLSRFVVAPIEVLEGAARRFAGGDMDVEIPVVSNDEMGRLARAFNGMVSAIRQKTTDLKKTAEELEGVSSVILRWDSRGRITYLNPFGLELFGYSEEEVIGEPLVGTIVPSSPEVEKSVRTMIDEITSDPTRYENDETENQRKNGELLFMAWRNQPILGEDGKLQEILTIGMDITERRRIEKEIAAQKQMLENTLESLTHPFYVIDAKDYSIKIANSAARALGQSGNSTCHALTHKSPTPCDSAEHICPMAEIKKTKEPVIVEHIHHDAEGNPRIMEVNGYPIFDDDGNVVQMIEYSVDITERKRAEAELRKLSRAVEQSSSSVVITNPAGAIEYVNPKFTEVTGYALDEALGQNPRVLKSGNQPPEFFEELWATISSGREWHGEFCNRKKNGELYWESASISPIRDGSGEITHYVAIKDDISDRKRMEEALLSAREAAEAANRAKSTFLANMSHELRTPMNAIIGYSEMLAEDAEDDGLDEMIPDLEKINAAGKHLLALINDILDLSKIEAGRMEVFLETFDLRQMLDEAVSTVTPLIAKNGNRLVADFGDQPISIHADLTKLRQALFNLLSNAAKFTENGTITLSAAIDRRNGEDWLLLGVADTGIGIREDKLDAVFEEFSQADDSTTRDYGGTGLGLPISRRFCRMMGGDIAVASELGKGTVFTIELPLRVEASKAAAPDPESGQSDRVQPKVGPRPILVVDDDPDSRDLLRRTLEAEGFSVATASTGEEGLELAKKLKPALMTLDVLMPSMDGWSVLQAVKADPELADTPVMMVSIAGDKELGYSLGAVECLTKPVDRDELRKLAAQYAAAAGGGRALVVDDDEGIRSLFQRALSDDGWEVFEAENGAVALEMATAERPDLILLDLMMPVMDGFEFVHHYREIDGCQSTPIIVVTSKDLDASDREQLLGGVERIVEKGALTPKELVRQVRELVPQSDPDSV